MENKAYPSISELKQRLSCFRDLIAYRIVTSLPKCYLKLMNLRKKLTSDTSTRSPTNFRLSRRAGIYRGTGLRCEEKHLAVIKR